MNIPVDISNVFLETDRLVIRPWKNEDLNGFYEYASVDIVGEMAGWKPHKSMEETQEILTMFIADKKTFALELKENNKVIGSIGLEKLSIDLGEPYTSLRGREIGYVLSYDYWGQGLMPEAVSRVMEYCYDELNCEFLQCSHEYKNDQSKRVIEKVGFQYLKDFEHVGKDGIMHRFKAYIKRQS